MLVRKCDVCGHIIGDEVGYFVDVFRTTTPSCVEALGPLIRIEKTLENSIELCYECKEAAFSALNERMTKYVLMGKEEEEEEQ